MQSINCLENVHRSPLTGNSLSGNMQNRRWRCHQGTLWRPENWKLLAAWYCLLGGVVAQWKLCGNIIQKQGCINSILEAKHSINISDNLLVMQPGQGQKKKDVACRENLRLTANPPHGLHALCSCMRS